MFFQTSSACKFWPKKVSPVDILGLGPNTLLSKPGDYGLNAIDGHNMARQSLHSYIQSTASPSMMKLLLLAHFNRSDEQYYTLQPGFAPSVVNTFGKCFHTSMPINFCQFAYRMIGKSGMTEICKSSNSIFP